MGRLGTSGDTVEGREHAQPREERCLMADQPLPSQPKKRRRDRGDGTIAWDKTNKSLVTISTVKVCEGEMGEWGGGEAIGMSSESVIGAGGCDTSALIIFISIMHTTLEWCLHLCLWATLQDLNFHPHVWHCCSQGGALATFTASQSHSCLAAQLHFCARHHFSF